MFETVGKWIVIIRFLLIFMGFIIYAIGKIPGLEKIPGTIRIQWGGGTFIFPILLSILLSIVLTLLINIISRLFK
jgi:hypothetical protein